MPLPFRNKFLATKTLKLNLIYKKYQKQMNKKSHKQPNTRYWQEKIKHSSIPILKDLKEK